MGSLLHIGTLLQILHRVGDPCLHIKVNEDRSHGREYMTLLHDNMGLPNFQDRCLDLCATYLLLTPIIENQNFPVDGCNRMVTGTYCHFNTQVAIIFSS